MAYGGEEEGGKRRLVNLQRLLLMAFLQVKRIPKGMELLADCLTIPKDVSVNADS